MSEKHKLKIDSSEVQSSNIGNIIKKNDGVAIIAIIALVILFLAFLTITTNNTKMIEKNLDLSNKAELEEVKLIKESKYKSIVEFSNRQWFVNNINDSCAELLSINSVAEMPYDTVHEKGTVTWENSDIRKYLNEIFYNTFSDDEKKYIIEVPLENYEQGSVFYRHETTFDKVYLLTFDEMVNNFDYWKVSPYHTINNQITTTICWCRSFGYYKEENESTNILGPSALCSEGGGGAHELDEKYLVLPAITISFN